MTDLDERAEGDQRAPSPTDQAQALKTHVTGVVLRLQSGYLRKDGGSTSESVSTLARLRRAQGVAGGADPRSWALVLEGLPTILQARDSASSVDVEPTRAEQAVYAALTTYAVHQQGRLDEQHVQGVGLGEATRRLARLRATGDAVGGLDEPTVQRLHRVSMAQTAALRVDALRALVTLMRGASRPVGLDYGRLAEDLFWLQFPGGAHRVQLGWGRGLHRFDQRTEVGRDPDQDQAATTTTVPETSGGSA